jgi:hypothetical protein
MAALVSDYGGWVVVVMERIAAAALPRSIVGVSPRRESDDCSHSPQSRLSHPQWQAAAARVIYSGRPKQKVINCNNHS